MYWIKDLYPEHTNIISTENRMTKLLEFPLSIWHIHKHTETHTCKGTHTPLHIEKFPGTWITAKYYFPIKCKSSHSKITLHTIKND